MRRRVAWRLGGFCLWYIAVSASLAQLPTAPPIATPTPPPVSTPPPADGRNLIGNPGFEDFPVDISPWTNTGNCYLEQFPGHSGSQYFAFNASQATPNGVLSQPIDTTPGTIYTLSFWQGINLYNQTASETLNVTVIGAANLVSQSYTITATAGTAGAIQWTQRTLTFTANSSSTTIQFADDPANPTLDVDLILDDVSVVATGGVAGPTPGTTPGPTPTPTPTPSPTPSVEDDMETDKDSRTVANGYVTTFHAGQPIVATGDASLAPIVPNITVATVSGDLVKMSASLVLEDKNGNPITIADVKPGTRMQAIEVVDDPNLGQVVQKIMVDQ